MITEFLRHQKFCLIFFRFIKCSKTSLLFHSPHKFCQYMEKPLCACPGPGLTSISLQARSKNKNKALLCILFSVWWYSLFWNLGKFTQSIIPTVLKIFLRSVLFSIKNSTLQFYRQNININTEYEHDHLLCWLHTWNNFIKKVFFFVIFRLYQ